LWSCDSDYRGLKKRITAIRRAQGDGTGRFVDLSSPESDPDNFPSVSGTSAHHVDGQENAEEGHEADDEGNTRRGKPEQRTVAHPLKKRDDDHSKVEIPHLFYSLHAFN